MLLPLLLFIIFTLLALLHLYWAAGGQWGLDAALPTNTKGDRTLNPGPVACIVVGTGLSAFAAFYLIRAGFISTSLPDWLLYYSGWLIPTIFLLRAAGDGKTVGLFKKVKDTYFAKMDSRYFTPLCLFLASAGYVIQLFQETMKTIYWSTTILISLFLIWSAWSYIYSKPTIDGVRELGFPDFFRVQLAVLKLIAVIILLLPQIPLPLKEWAYAGVGLFLLTAIVAHTAHGDPVAITLINLILIGILVTSRITLHQSIP